MAVLIIKKLGEPVLKTKAETVIELTKEIKKLIQDMKETMLENDGVGLAAPQVGVSKRVIIVQTGEGIRGFVNPNIIKQGKEKTFEEEGCLSLPGLRLKIKRSKEVEVETWDENGQEIKIEAEGIIARTFQHEIDHLDGILFSDRFNKFSLILQRIKNFF